MRISQFRCLYHGLIILIGILIPAIFMFLIFETRHFINLHLVANNGHLFIFDFFLWIPDLSRGHTRLLNYIVLLNKSI